MPILAAVPTTRTAKMFANYTSCCRLCLADKVASLNSIYAGYPDADTLVEKIDALIGVQITSRDKLSTMLCDKCHRNINNWEVFRKRCLQNQEKLREWLNNSTDAPVVQIKEEPIDVDDHDETVLPVEEPHEEEETAVKPEPDDLIDPIDDYPDLPPALSPCPPALTREVVEENAKRQEEDDKNSSEVSLENVGGEHMIRINPENVNSREYLRTIRSTSVDDSELRINASNRKMPQISLETDTDSKKSEDIVKEKTVPKFVLQSSVEIRSSIPFALDMNNLNGISKKLACLVCNKTLSNTSNKRKHEKMMHGLHGGGDVKKRNSLPIMHSEVAMEAESENSQESEKTQSSNISEIEQEKITFAAGLRLQSKSATPTPTPTQNSAKSADLTKIEWNYLERNRIILTMFKRSTCCCHNQHFGTWKKLIMHLRASYAWFTPFTCYNCLVVFPGRSGKMRHHMRCPRTEYEYLGRISESRVRTEDKIRLYHNYKCMLCNMIFYFPEDYYDHVKSQHVADDESYACKCEKVFESMEEFTRHVFKTCYVKHHCDVCFTTFNDVDEFKQHCEDTHDKDVSFEFLTRHPAFSVYDGETVKRILNINGKPPSLKPISKMDDADDIKVINPLALSANFNCKLCDHQSTSYSNLLKHMKGLHKTQVSDESERGICDICGAKFSSFHNMLRHRKVHNEDMKQLKCPECPEKFRLNVELKDHLSAIHSTGRPVRLIHRCTECGESFKNIPTLEEHKKTHMEKCEECGKEFYTNKEYEQHRNSHLTLTLKRDPHTLNYSSLSPGNKMCQLCDRQFEMDEELQAHMKLHETMPTLEAENDPLQKTYNCFECDKIYYNSKSLWAHNRRFHPGVTSSNKGFPRTCEECGRTITTHPAWLMHQQMHKRNSLKAEPKTGSDNSREDSDYHTCKRCFKVFANRSNLKNHMKSHGINTSPNRPLTKAKPNKTYWCDACHTACQGLVELNKHKLECNVSEADSETRSNDTAEDVVTSKKLRKNLPITINPQEELNRKPVYCKYCKIPFTSSTSLSQHMQREHEEKSKVAAKSLGTNKYSCSVCKKCFSTAGALNTHQGWHKRSKTSKLQIKNEFNGKPVEKPHKCKTCGNSFEDDTTLQLHILEIHRNINTSILSTSKCRHCSHEFKTRAELDHHEKTHHQPEKKPYEKKTYLPAEISKIGVSCKYCNKIFSRSDYLNLHINKKHPEYATAGHYKCTQCNRVFDKQNALSIHLKVHEKLNTNTAAPTQSNPNRVYKYSCSICHAGYDLPKDLRNHIITSHPF